jgi:IS30 family transposase
MPRIHKLSATRTRRGGKGKRRVWKGKKSGQKIGMKYRQLNGEERSVLAAFRQVGLKPAEIARELGRHRSTVSRELKRNAAPYDEWYRARRAQQRAHARRYRSRRNSQFGREHWERVEGLLREEWSPEQVSGHLRLKRELAISHETIYRHIWRDLRSGGTLHEHLRGARKSCRKRYGRYDSRGRLAGKRMIGERPAGVERRRQMGHWEIDTMMGESPGESSHCVLTWSNARAATSCWGNSKRARRSKPTEPC